MVVEHNGTNADNVDAIVRRMVATLLWPVNIPLWRLIMCVLINSGHPVAHSDLRKMENKARGFLLSEVFFFLRLSRAMNRQAWHILKGKRWCSI